MNNFCIIHKTSYIGRKVAERECTYICTCVCYWKSVQFKSQWRSRWRKPVFATSKNRRTAKIRCTRRVPRGTFVNGTIIIVGTHSLKARYVPSFYFRPSWFIADKAWNENTSLNFINVRFLRTVFKLLFVSITHKVFHFQMHCNSEFNFFVITKSGSQIEYKSSSSSLLSESTSHDVSSSFFFTFFNYRTLNVFYFVVATLVVTEVVMQTFLFLANKLI